MKKLKKKNKKYQHEGLKSHTCRKMGIILMQSIEVVTNQAKKKINGMMNTIHINVYHVYKMCFFEMQHSSWRKKNEETDFEPYTYPKIQNIGIPNTHI